MKKSAETIISCCTWSKMIKWRRTVCPSPSRISAAPGPVTLTTVRWSHEISGFSEISDKYTRSPTSYLLSFAFWSCANIRWNCLSRTRSSIFGCSRSSVGWGAETGKQTSQSTSHSRAFAGLWTRTWLNIRSEDRARKQCSTVSVHRMNC